MTKPHHTSREPNDSRDAEAPDRPLAGALDAARYLPYGAEAPSWIRIPATRPRSARHVGTLWWRWKEQVAPTRDRLFLAPDKSGNAYLLWVERADHIACDTRVTAFVAQKDLDPEAAASALVLATYRGEKTTISASRRWLGWEPGILATDALLAIAERVGQRRALEPRAAACSKGQPRGGRAPRCGAARILNMADELILAAAALRPNNDRPRRGTATLEAYCGRLVADALEACARALTAADARTKAGMQRIAMAAGCASRALSKLFWEWETSRPRRRKQFATLGRLLSELTELPTSLAAEGPGGLQARSRLWGASVALTRSDDAPSVPGVGSLDQRLEALQESFTGPSAVGELVRFPNPADFQPDILEEWIDEERLNELYDGALPTAEELELWERLEFKARSESLDAPCFHLVSVWMYPDKENTRLVWAYLHADHWDIWERIGPYRTIPELERHLRAIGRFRWSWGP
jgi:hypothetical protein